MIKKQGKQKKSANSIRALSNYMDPLKLIEPMKGKRISQLLQIMQIRLFY